MKAIVHTDEAIKQLGAFAKLVPTETIHGLEEAFFQETAEAQGRVSRFSDELHDSIDGIASQSGDTVQGLWGAHAEHAEPVEFGAKRHFVPERYIGDWAAAHGFGHTGLIVSGKARPFLRRNVNERLTAVGERVAALAVEEIDGLLQLAADSV